MIRLFGGEYLEESMENEEVENIPEPEITLDGKWKCREDNMEFDTKEDYETHYKEEHSE